ncbi:MAG: hypothetical protein KAQ88_01890 [Hyphomicrobiaceae bacterium]|nr:hypothetical protein [Hyphomicrobiaceae bacterium]
MAQVYNRAKTNIGSVWDWDDAGQTFKLMLVTSAYVYADTHNTRSDVTGEITNVGYTAGGDAITGRTATQDDGTSEGRYDAANVTYSPISAGDLPAFAIVYRDTGIPATDDLVCCLTLSTVDPPDGSPYRIAFNAEGVFKLTN